MTRACPSRMRLANECEADRVDQCCEREAWIDQSGAMCAADHQTVTDDALRRITPAFDLNRNLIYAIAAKVYGRGRKGSYELVAADF